jgi:uncharacterized protein YbaP (TraB family)
MSLKVNDNHSIGFLVGGPIGSIAEHWKARVLPVEKVIKSVISGISSQGSKRCGQITKQLFAELQMEGQFQKIKLPIKAQPFLENVRDESDKIELLIANHLKWDGYKGVKTVCLEEFIQNKELKVLTKKIMSSYLRNMQEELQVSSVVDDALKSDPQIGTFFQQLMAAHENQKVMPQISQERQEEMQKQLIEIATKRDEEFKARFHHGVSAESFNHSDEYASLKVTMGEVLKVMMEGIQAPAPKPNRKIIGHFYEIHSSKGDLLGYLFGTFHMIHPALMPLNDRINVAINRSDRVFLEIAEMETQMEEFSSETRAEINKLSPEEVETGIKNYRHAILAQLTKGGKRDFLKKTDRLSPKEHLLFCFEEYYRIEALLRGTVCGNGKSPIFSLDQFIYYRFKEQHKPILGLESFEEHKSFAKYLDKSSDRFDIEPGSIEIAPKVISIASQFTRIWCDGKVPDGWENQVNEKGSREYLLGEGRSITMGQRIVKELSNPSKAPAFFAIGGLHFYDAENVIKRLKNEGFVVSRIE